MGVVLLNCHREGLLGLIRAVKDSLLLRTGLRYSALTIIIYHISLNKLIFARPCAMEVERHARRSARYVTVSALFYPPRFQVDFNRSNLVSTASTTSTTTIRPHRGHRQASLLPSSASATPPIPFLNHRTDHLIGLTSITAACPPTSPDSAYTT